MTPARRRGVLWFTLLLTGLFLLAGPRPLPAAPDRPGGPPKPGLFYYDCHTHLMGLYGQGESDWQGAVQEALATMQRLGIRLSIVMPPPFSPGHPNTFDAEELARALEGHRDKLAFLAGGGSLNVMIQKAVAQGRVTPEMKREFRRRALEILELGAVGFGEFAAEHFSFNPRHPYEWAPPDHPLFLLLADIAAQKGVPIDLHMEAVPQDMPKPPDLTSPNNPPVIKANIAALERLLAHNPKAKIIWAHAGWGRSGHRTPQLCAQLMARHPNLYMSIKIRPPRFTSPAARMFLPHGDLRPQWLKVLKRYPGRFFIGSDAFYATPWLRGDLPRGAGGPWRLLKLLPPELARRIGLDTPLQVFGPLPPGATPKGGGAL